MLNENKQNVCKSETYSDLRVVVVLCGTVTPVAPVDFLLNYGSFVLVTASKTYRQWKKCPFNGLFLHCSMSVLEATSAPSIAYFGTVLCLF